MIPNKAMHSLVACLATEAIFYSSILQLFLLYDSFGPAKVVLCICMKYSLYMHVKERGSKKCCIAS